MNRFGPIGKCLYPFIELTCSSVGWYPCCAAFLKIELEKKSTDLMDAWNSEVMQKIRAGVLNGSYSECNMKTCALFHDSAKTLRQNISKDVLLSVDQKKTVLSFPPERFKMASSDDCNLFCPSCRSGPIYNTEVSRTNSLKFFEQIKAYAVRKIYLQLDGEVFHNEVSLEFMKTFKKEHAPDLLECIILTNGTLLTEELWSSFTEDFRSIVVGITISIDAITPDSYERIRLGASFSDVLRGISVLSRLQRENKIQWSQLHFVLQKENVDQFSSFQDFAEKYGIMLCSIFKLQDWPSFRQSLEYLRSHDVWQTDHPLYGLYKLEYLKMREAEKISSIRLLTNLDL